ncbi:FHA domain-containing protein [Mycobacterium sp. ITM-2016-00316]|uniref:FHA domain-containing protein n=1 Tax=Mycobacterium sp. ITM-2016-00316 TaxID=2099695 RepID=UPI00287F6566|nr:FHA domain-containing protein [Mycobacterium sp. ITM-2016-00316]WNG85048.1 FHA domain-containing protein [Mycobacterium sp. ITM-2016-00316]
MNLCKAHGPFDGESCHSPGCIEDWMPYVPPAETPPIVCAAPGCDMPQPCPLHPQASEHPHLRARRAVREDPAAAPVSDEVARVRFPWGPITVPSSGVLNIGRDFGIECGSQISEFDNVSRRHAVIRVADGSVVVEDQLSTNGTTVNGVAVAPYAPHPVKHGDTLGFGAHLRALIECAEDNQ